MSKISVNHALMQLSKEIEMNSSEGEYVIFSDEYDINLDLLVFGEYAMEKLGRYDLEDTYQI